MTMRMETLDGGTIDTGFYSGDISKVQLGELPPITTQQLVGYAAIALTQNIIPKITDDTRAKWAKRAQWVNEQVKDAPTMHLTGKFFMQGADELASQFDTVDASDKHELLIELAAAVVPTKPAEYYAENPFRVQEDGQRVGFVYEDNVQHVVDANDFFFFTNYILHGGWLGWGDNGTYPEVKDAAEQINAALV